jgi:DNA-binding GntR family transcriptional regulator
MPRDAVRPQCFATPGDARHIEETVRNQVPTMPDRATNPGPHDHPPLHGRVVAQLRQAILCGRLKPGERLIEERLAENLGVSRNPVREAIRALASEGLVEVTARRGASVLKLTAQEARETIEVRALLEGHNARLAARHRDDAIIRRIEKVLGKGTRAVAAGRFDQLLALNQEFHRELHAAGRNTVLGDIVQKLRERTAMLFSPTDPARQSRSWQEHAAILRAVIDGDERAAAALAAEHVMRAGADYLFGVSGDEIGMAVSLPPRLATADPPFPRRGGAPRVHGRNRKP